MTPLDDEHLLTSSYDRTCRVWGARAARSAL